jgi:signal peptidase I
MSWATCHIVRLKSGQTVQFRPRGNSMIPKIHSGQLCTVEPITDPKRVQEGSIVLCKVRGQEYLHLVSARRGDQYQISNNKGHVNGWVSLDSIYGVLVSVED